ncbi:MAG: DUF2958 domain-containing protein [Bacteroidetes bacterium]|nr:DUF2958 domain-containing protein [Bacteroidota bacterium]
MKLITEELKEQFKQWGDQSQIKDPMILAKFFDPCGSATWWISQYDPQTNIAYGYVTGLVCDEWGSVSIEELEAIKRPFGLRIERDLYFTPGSISKVCPGYHKEQSTEDRTIERDTDLQQ